MTFRPATLRIARGDTVLWINRDPVPHTATVSAAWGTAVLAMGDSGFLVADRRGDIRYTCSLHPTMEARISVRSRVGQRSGLNPHARLRAGLASIESAIFAATARTPETGMEIEKANLSEELARVAEPWRPRVVATLNGQELKVVRIRGEFVWHHHDDVDELFLGVRGRFRIEFRDRVVEIGPGDLLVVPRGVEHRPVADEEAEVALFEPAGVRNTGNVEHPTLTAPS